MNLKSLLDPFKGVSSPCDTLPVILDKRLLMVIWAWTKVKIEWDPLVEVNDVPKDEFDLWNFLWEHVQWDPDDLAFLSGMSYLTAVKSLEKARRFRLIYPDGTIGEQTTDVITKYMAKMAKKNMGSFNSLEEEMEDGLN